MSTSNAKTYLLTLLRRRRACHLNFRRYEVETKILDLVSLRFLLWGCGAQKEVSFTLDSLLVCEIQRNSLLLDPKNLLLLSPLCLTEQRRPLPTPPSAHRTIRYTHDIHAYIYIHSMTIIVCFRRRCSSNFGSCLQRVCSNLCSKA
jgi:hypothetical protein